MDASETGKDWNETKAVKKSKNFIFKSFFLYDGAENRPPQPGFLNSCYQGLSNYTCYFFKKKQLDASETGKVWNETKAVKKSKNFIFKSFFLYDGAENRPPQPRFLNSCYRGLSNFTCYFLKNYNCMQVKLEKFETRLK